MPKVKKHTIQRKLQSMHSTAFSLLLFYVFGTGPGLLFHHHEEVIAEYARATPCEKTIYFAHADEDCHHAFHFSKAVETCYLCDNHTVSPNTFPLHFSVDIQLHYIENTGEGSPSIFSQTPTGFSNRGPPSASSFRA